LYDFPETRKESIFNYIISNRQYHVFKKTSHLCLASWW